MDGVAAGLPAGPLSGLSVGVWVTKSGTALHGDRNCSMLRRSKPQRLEISVGTGDTIGDLEFPSTHCPPVFDNPVHENYLQHATRIRRNAEINLSLRAAINADAGYDAIRDGDGDDDGTVGGDPRDGRPERGVPPGLPWSFPWDLMGRTLAPFALLREPRASGRPDDRVLAALLDDLIVERVSLAAELRTLARMDEWGYRTPAGRAVVAELGRLAAAHHVEASYDSRRPGTAWAQLGDLGYNIARSVLSPPQSLGQGQEPPPAPALRLVHNSDASRTDDAGHRSPADTLAGATAGVDASGGFDADFLERARAISNDPLAVMRSALFSGGQECWPMFWLRDKTREPVGWKKTLEQWLHGATYSGFPVDRSTRVTIMRELPSYLPALAAAQAAWDGYLDGLVVGASESIGLAVPVSSVNSLNHHWVAGAIACVFDFTFTPSDSDRTERSFGELSRHDIVSSGPGVVMGSAPSWARWAFAARSSAVTWSLTRSGEVSAVLAQEVARLVNTRGEFADDAAVYRLLRDA